MFSQRLVSKQVDMSSAPFPLSDIKCVLQSASEIYLVLEVQYIVLFTELTVAFRAFSQHIFRERIMIYFMATSSIQPVSMLNIFVSFLRKSFSLMLIGLQVLGCFCTSTVGSTFL